MKLYNHKSIKNTSTHHIQVEKCKFISNIKPVNTVNEAMEFISQVKSEHKQATHNVFSYLIGENPTEQRYTDDGEPSGTAGLPILEMLKSKELTNIVIVVTRYFGGKKLGTGGLVRAYTRCAKEGLQKSVIIERNAGSSVEFSVNYSIANKVDYFLSQNTQVILKNKEFSDIVKFTLLISDDIIDQIINTLIDYLEIDLKYRVIDKEYIDVK